MSHVEAEPRGVGLRACRASPARCRCTPPRRSRPAGSRLSDEVAGAGADLERAREVRRARRPAPCAACRSPGARPTSPKSMPHFASYVGCGDVVVAHVDVADLRSAVAGGGMRRGTIYSRARDRRHAFVQQDQPPGVPPLALTGERTLPDVPEENYWYRRHLAVYEWIAARDRRPARRRHGLRRGLRRGGAGSRGAASVVGVDANPEAHEHARLRYRAREPPLRARPGRDLDRDEPVDAVVFLQTIEHVEDPGALLDHFRSLARAPAASPTSRRPTCSRSPRPARSARATRGTCTSTAPRSSATCAPRTSTRVELLRPLPRAQAARARAGAARWAGTRVHAALGLTQRFYDRFTPAIAARDFALRPRARRTSTARSTSSPSCGREPPAHAAPGRARARPAHAHALRRGLRDVAVRRGVALGGDRDLLPAAARRARPARR